MGKTEYELIREEILFYLDKHQTVRNMMYVTTGALLGLVSNANNAYLYLLPLIVIIPSFVTSHDYLDNVYRASTYLKVFYEEGKLDYHWETRLREFRDTSQRWQRIHRMPYEVCAISCIILYWFNDNDSLCMKSLIAFFCAQICFFCITCYRKIDEKEYINRWEKIRDKKNF